jgi:hypothetical protein
MSTRRLYNLLVVIALVVIVALTVREAATASSVVSRSNAHHYLTDCESLPSRYVAHTEYVEGVGTSISYSVDGTTGRDDGLIRLLSKYRTCRDGVLQ